MRKIHSSIFSTVCEQHRYDYAVIVLKSNYYHKYRTQMVFPCCERSLCVQSVRFSMQISSDIAHTDNSSCHHAQNQCDFATLLSNGIYNRIEDRIGFSLVLNPNELCLCDT